MIQQWKNKVSTFVEVHETACTALLMVVAIVLIAVAVYGKPPHKAAAILYIVL